MARWNASPWIAAGLLAGSLVLAAGTAVAEERGGERDGARRGPRERLGRLLDQRARMRHGARLLRMKRMMDAPEEQVRAALETSREAARVREAARDRAAAILVEAFREGKDAAPEARAAIRARTRERMKALREEFRAPLTEAGRKAAAALAPEQRAGIEERARARGRTVDEDRLARVLAWRLSDPRAGALLRARLGQGR